MVVKPGNVMVIQDTQIDRDDIVKLSWAGKYNVDFVSFRKVNNREDMEELHDLITNYDNLKKLVNAPSYRSGT
jgi:hypothetical protein